MEKIRVLLWGTGKVAQWVLAQCNTIDCYTIEGVIDNNKEKQGQYFYGYKIVNPVYIRESRPEKIVVLSDSFDEISTQIYRDFPEYSQSIENKYFFFKESILLRYASSDNPEIKEVLSYIREKGLNIFNYPFVEKYKDQVIDVYRDEVTELFYVYHNGKKLFFSRDFTDSEKVREYYRSIIIEQDVSSPHRYLSKTFEVQEGDVVVDCGAAEGNFSLEIVDIASEVYLIETDDAWIQALEQTFKNYSEKVHIIKAFLSSYDEGQYCTLDSLIDKPVNYIKMDLEGNEWDALIGSERLISISPSVKIVTTCYHSDFDKVLIENELDAMNLIHEESPGLMWYPALVRQNYVSTRLNRGLLRARKQ